MTLRHATDVEDKRSSWAPVDLQSVLAGDLEQPSPTVLRRTDGAGVFYPGKTNLIVGPTEQGKSWIALLAIAQTIRDGGVAGFIDFEDDAMTFCIRLGGLGLSEEEIASRSVYVRPRERGGDEFETLARLGADVWFGDGMTEWLSLLALKARDETDVARLYGMVRPFTDAGAAFVFIDHTPLEGGRPLGTQHKLAGISGAALLVDAVSSWRRDAECSAALYVLKDRPGGLEWRPKGKRRLAGTARLLPTEGGVEMMIEAPVTVTPATSSHSLRPGLRHVLEALRPGWRTTDQIAGDAGIKSSTARDALRELVEAGSAERSEASRDASGRQESARWRRTATEPRRDQTPSRLARNRDGEEPQVRTATDRDGTATEDRPVAAGEAATERAGGLSKKTPAVAAPGERFEDESKWLDPWGDPEPDLDADPGPFDVEPPLEEFEESSA